MNSRLLTAQEVADRLGVPKTWVYEQSRKGTIPTVTLGHYRRYRVEAIDAWVAQLIRRDFECLPRGGRRRGIGARAQPGAHLAGSQGAAPDLMRRDRRDGWQLRRERPQQLVRIRSSERKAGSGDGRVGLGAEPRRRCSSLLHTRRRSSCPSLQAAPPPGANSFAGSGRRPRLPKRPGHGARAQRGRSPSSWTATPPAWSPTSRW